MTSHYDEHASTGDTADGPGHADRVPVSIVCVFNEPSVLASCLQASFDAGHPDAASSELIPIDNREGQFSTAGGALNHGARLAKNDVVVFVHQDVVLHSLPAIERAAATLLRDPSIGILGSVGIDGRHEVIGRIRDRVVQIGESAPAPRDIETLDEVLFMITREDVLREPLAETPILAWHAYAVEYCLRVRRAGRRAVAMDVPITHNSLTTNLARLDEAHRHVGDTYPELLPIHTTCGIVHSTRGPSPIMDGLRRGRGAAVWLGESLRAGSVERTVGHRSVVLADVRLIVDEAAEIAGKRALRVIDVATDGELAFPAGGLDRFGRDFRVDVMTAAEARSELARRSEDELLLISGLDDVALTQLAPLEGVPHVIGHSRDTGLWAFIGLDADDLRALWPTTRNRPFAGLLPVGARTGTSSS
ncbi:glycosyltransferase [Microbacterium sp. SLBN-146]|uniref:glycosyltransferase n=1 Tax=Microbacterium sp. SLBN-146 TaxID=2768457 RepID=UPI00114FC8AE|nr:glycosyltransferase [Microbacterium sp. SLBN-146]TQJ30601.1 glycosyl transferase family 2 [Microbacterium sp. SLBN-146]